MKNSSREVRQLQQAINLADQRFLINRMRNRIFHPPYESPWYGKVFGYSWRIGMTLLVLGVVSYGLLKRQLASRSYRGVLAEEISKRYHATNVFCGKAFSPMLKRSCVVSTLTAEGAEGSFFKKLSAKNLEFDLGFQFVRTDWTIDLLNISELSLDFRTGGVEPVMGTPEEHLPATEDPTNRAVIPEFKTGSVGVNHPPLLAAGIGIRPDFSELKIKAYEATNVTLTWGFSTTTEGGLRKCDFASLYPAADGWKLLVRGGNFEQNWLKGFKLEDLEVLISDDKANVVSSNFNMGPNTSASAHGTVKLGAMPQLDLDFEIKGIDLRNAAPEPLRKYFFASANLQGKATGTLNHVRGLQTQIHVDLRSPVEDVRGLHLSGSKPTFRNKPVIAYLTNQVAVAFALYVASGEEVLAQTPLTAGSFDLSTGDSQMSMTNINLQSADLLKITGKLSSREQLVASATKRQVGQEDKSIPIMKYEYDADLRIGVHPATVGAMPKLFREKYFQEESDGYRWMTVKVEKGDLAEFTKSLAIEMAEVQKEAILAGDK